MNGKIILIVEDDRDIRGLLSDFLKREGFMVEVAESGAAADRVLARVMPDLVVLDLMLPGEDGLSICRRLRARGSIQRNFQRRSCNRPIKRAYAPGATCR